MNFFQITKVNLILMGFRSDHLLQRCPLNGKNLLGLVFYAFILLSDFMFILFEAKDIRQYLDIFYMAATVLADAISFTIMVFIADDLFEFIRKCEKIANKSKLTLNIQLN